MVILDSYRTFIVTTVPTPSRLKRYFAVIARWCTITFVVFALTLWAGKYITENVLPKTYTATAEIEVRALETTGFAPIFDHIESSDVLAPVINDLGLETAWAKRISSLGTGPFSQADALSHLKKILKLDQKRGTDVIGITVSSDDSGEAAQIANAVADRYKAKCGADAVRILSRPEAPEYPSSPNKLHCFIATIGVAALISVVVGCFVEVIMLFARAAESEDS
jgi:capsular polysaccharide biosynthesis protein